MNYRKNSLFSQIVLLSLCLVPLLSLGAERQDLYKSGNEAFDQSDYVTAVKHLYAFYVLNESELASHPELKQKLERRIATCESILRIAYLSNPSIHAGKNRVRIHTSTPTPSFIGNGRQVQLWMQDNSPELKRIQEINQKELISPSRKVHQ